MPEPAATQVKQTPGRRKQGPNGARPGHRKNYASENDVSSVDGSAKPDFAPRQKNNVNKTGGPTTPQKTQKNAVAAQNAASASQPASGKAGKRGGGKNVPKSTCTSPAPAKKVERTPPQTSLPMAIAPIASAPAMAAFAGATFHASPAASSLPIPSFVAKTNSPGTPRARPVSGLSQQPSPPASDSELPSATHTSVTDTMTAGHHRPLYTRTAASVQPPPHSESPLDMFFRADRAEKERNRRASSANIFSMSGPVSPPSHMQVAPNTVLGNSFPRDGPQQMNQYQQQPSRSGLATRTSSGISPAELDGTPGQPIGPAFATPFTERMRAARPQEVRAPPCANAGLAGFRDVPSGPVSVPFIATGNQQAAPPTTDDRSEALKRFLFSKTGTATPSGPTAVSASVPTTPTRYPGPRSGPLPPGGYAASPFQGVYAPSPASGAPNQQPYPGYQAYTTPNNVNGGGGQANTGNPGKGNGASNVSAMEESLRQILKLDSPFGGSNASPGFSSRP